MCWNLGTLIGALAGEAIDPETYGLDAAFPAGFVAMLAPHLRTRTGRAVALVGALICLAHGAVRPDRRADPVRRDGGADRAAGAMTWTLVLLLAAAAYSFKVLGLVVIGRRQLPATLERCLALIPAALIAALIVNDTFADGKDLVIDARAAGVAAAARGGVAAGAADRRDRDRRRRDRDGPPARLIDENGPVQPTATDEAVERPQVAPPDPPQHRLPADQPGDGTAEPPREPQVLLPREPGAAAEVDRLEREAPRYR